MKIRTTGEGSVDSLIALNVKRIFVDSLDVIADGKMVLAGWERDNGSRYWTEPGKYDTEFLVVEITEF